MNIIVLIKLTIVVLSFGVGFFNLVDGSKKDDSFRVFIGFILLAIGILTLFSFIETTCVN